MAKSTDKETTVEPVAETKVAGKPDAAAVYHELVHTKTTGWPEEAVVEHKKKCAEALAAKRKKN